MKNSANSNIYEVNANNVLTAYDGFVEGTPETMLLVVSTCAPSPEARTAIESSADSLGFKQRTAWVHLNAPEGANSVATVLGAKDLMAIIEGLDPLALIVLDEKGIATLAEAYRCDIPEDSHVRVFGRDTATFHDFASMLDNSDAKQKAWAILKKLGPKR